MARLCEGRVVVVTGAGRGIGRGHALEFARQGAKVVVNDNGAEVDGTGGSEGPAAGVVEEIRAAGGEARLSLEDVSDWDGAKRLIDDAVAAYGPLDVLVNNAGILRDRMLTNMTVEEWDGVIRVHLRGTFAPSNTSSASGIYGNVGQNNYGAAKAGIAAMTIISSEELRRYGVTVNAVAPGALTRMTENLTGLLGHESKPDEFDARHADNIAPLVVWLGSTESRGVTGRVFNVRGGHISVAEGWVAGPAIDKDSRWDPEELGSLIPELVARAAPNANMNGERD
jgi:NAD(P)-dependent dehydrogenase (short-subunit alcohol dehydrogenase family)